MFIVQCFDIQELKLPQDTLDWCLSYLFGDYDVDSWGEFYPYEWTESGMEGTEIITFPDYKRHIQVLKEALLQDGWNGLSSPDPLIKIKL